MIDDDDEIVEVQLNMDHPFVRQMHEFVGSAPREMVDAFCARMMRRGVFDSAMDDIGGLTKYRRKMVVRALVKMFRAGHRSGYMAGRYSRSEEPCDGE